MSANDSASKTNTGVAKSPNPPGGDETALNNTQIWGSVTNATSGQNSVHYPATVAYPYDPSQIATPAYDMSTYASATPLYQYSPFQYTNDGYQQSYDENFQSGEALTGYDGSSSQYPAYSVPIDQNSYFVGAQDGQGNAIYGKKPGNLSLFDTSSENYTAHWVSSTTNIPADLKVSPDHPSDSIQNSNDFPSVNWNETQADTFTSGTAGSGQNQTFNANSQVQQQEALDQQLAQMNLGYNVQQQQYTSFGYQGAGANTGQAWQANFPPPDSRPDQNNGQPNRNSGFYGQTSNGSGEFGASPGSTPQKASAGAPGQASWAEMVKKNGAHPGEVRHQPPPTSASNGGNGQNYQSGQRNNQNFQRGNQSGQSQGVRNFNSQRTYQNNTGPSGANNKQNNGSVRNNYSAVSPNQQIPYLPGPYYSTQPPQNGPYNSRGNNGYNQRSNGMGQRFKQPQNVRPNVGYAGFNNNHRPGAAGPGYGMPTEFNPFVPPPPLIPLTHRPGGNGPGAGLQQPQGGPLFAGPPYIMFNPAQQQFRYFNNQQFLVRPEPLMPSMYPNDPYFQMRFRPPFDFDPRFGPPMFNMPRYRGRGNNRGNNRGNKYQNNKQLRPNSKSDVNSVSPRDDKENKKEGEKLDEELAESVNRGTEFELGNGPTPEPKGDIQISDEKKADGVAASEIPENEEFKFPIENLEKEEAAKEDKE
ncbi:hypothetical protein FO519_000862 [Halicephalobus sp. NKZ332]|nr:hypothetical protein FO519_000862 [Halicephalobus sp. NKZ332]